MIRKASLIALPFLLLACSGEPSEEVATTDLEGTEAPTTNPAVENFADALVVVDANGLGARGQDMLRFGATRADVDAAMKKAFDIAPETSRNEECGAGPMDFSQYGPLQIAFMDGEFRGWFLREGRGVVTSDGVQPGTTTMQALKLEKQVRKIDTTLEGEFEYTAADYGTITGFADGEGSITALQAGISCFFR